MDQASRIIAGWSDASALIGPERIALAAWKRAVGKRLAERTRPAKLVRDKLVVEVEDQVWRENLFALRHQILRNLREVIGSDIVQEVEFRIMPPRREPQRENRAAAAGATLFDEADAIEDPGMRRIYKAARRRETS